MPNSKSENRTVLDGVAEYYAAKIAAHGDSPRGVDWNGVESQELRFKQLSRCIDSLSEFSLNDLGCGYGAYFDYLHKSYSNFRYNGWDISAEMIAAAKRRHVATPSLCFMVATEPSKIADYGVASGIFNVRLGISDEDWLKHIKKIIRSLDATSSRGFAFNCLTKYSDKEKMRDYLYYADPCLLFDFCKKNFSQNVSLLHDYGLYEFTIIVRK